MISLSKGHFKAGYDAVRSSKFRSFWTMMGVIIGVASVITVVSIGEGIKRQVGSQLHSDQNLIIVRPAQLRTSADTGSPALNSLSGLNISAPLSRKDVATIAKAKGVEASAPLTLANGTVKSDTGVYKDGLVLGTSPDLPSLLNQSIAYGTFFNDEDNANAAVIGQGVADKLFDTDLPLGYRFTFRGEEFIVVGIFNNFNTTPLSQQADFNNAVFIKNDVVEDITRDSAATYAVLARPGNTGQIEQTASAISSVLGSSHGNQADFEVLTGSEDISNSNTILNLVTSLIAGVAAISLFVAGVGIMNVMLVSVAERVHEIGIRKAVGASNRQILNQFLIESSVLTLGGGIIGIVLALIGNAILRVTTNLKPIINWEIVLVACGVSLLVGVIFGTIPAIQAARKNPIDALRAE